MPIETRRARVNERNRETSNLIPLIKILKPRNTANRHAATALDRLRSQLKVNLRLWLIANYNVNLTAIHLHKNSVMAKGKVCQFSQKQSRACTVLSRNGRERVVEVPARHRRTAAVIPIEWILSKKPTCITRSSKNITKLKKFCRRVNGNLSWRA